MFERLGTRLGYMCRGREQADLNAAVDQVWLRTTTRYSHRFKCSCRPSAPGWLSPTYYAAGLEYLFKVMSIPAPATKP